MNEHYIVTVGELYYTGLFNNMMCFTTDVEKAYIFWNKDSADSRAKECCGTVVKFIEVK